MKSRTKRTTGLMTIKRWYGNAIRIPNYNSPEFVPFAAACMGMVRSLIEDKMENKIYTIFSDMGKNGTAYANQENSTIVINQSYLAGRYDERKPDLPSDEALTFVLGLIVHEAAHFAYSPPDTTTWTEYVRNNTSFKFVESVAKVLGNIVEDIFIEAEVERRFPVICWCLDFLNGVTFSDEQFEEATDKVKPMDKAPVEIEDIGCILNLLIYAKTRCQVDSNPFIQELFGMALSAKKLGSIDERNRLTLSLYDRLMENFNDFIGAFENQLIQKGVGDRVSGATHNKALPENGTVKTGTGHAHALNETIKGFGDKRISLVEEKNSNHSTVIIEETPDESWIPHGYVYQIDKKFLVLAEHSRQRATVNKPYGIAMNRGNTLRHLSRIVTDQRVFAEQVPVTHYKPMQVQIVIDCSSSMCHETAVVDGQRVSKFHAAIAAAGGVASGLEEGRCEVAIYLHTFGMNKMEEVNIFMVKSFQDSMAVAMRRLSIVNSCNKDFRWMSRDGVAFEYLAKKFTSLQKRRVMLVISDGEPNSVGYQGLHGIQQTHESVNRIRSLGIDVLSLSIDSIAYAPNNTIYGKENNTCHQDPTVLQDMAMQLLNR